MSMKPAEIESKWQKRWEKSRIYSVKRDPSKKKYYVLEMFPYTSARIHMGHVRNYSIGDVFARYKLMCGFNVLHPIGFDAFGLPAENAAIKEDIHPTDWTYQNINTIRNQLKRLGFSYDWQREVITCDPKYYRWTQWLFLKFYKRGLVYKKTDYVNWCNSCKTVLANEQVEGGRCWRCETEVIQKSMESWFFKITDYAKDLLRGYEQLISNWPRRVIEMQKNWIGRSEGVEIKFKIRGAVLHPNEIECEELPVFTTRPDTIFGATYVVLSPEHPIVNQIISRSDMATQRVAEIQKFVEKVKAQRKIETVAEVKKEGIWTGFYAINPVNNEQIPLWIANYVLMEYGTGAIMAVPTHDQRDFEFAKKYDLPLRIVIKPENNEISESTMTQAYEGEGFLVNSGKFNGLPNREAMTKIADWMEENKIGNRKVYYRLRDWSISRQRYWGEPIPIVYCKECGTVPVPEKDLPVLLPKEVNFKAGGSPLSTSSEFVNTICPKCKRIAKRETDTLDCFVASSWYFLRYLSPQWDKGPFRKEDAEYWMPVDQYIGGAEHATKHLIYARFFMMVMKDMGLCKESEPFKRLLCQGMVIKDGAKMSKSKGNIVDPIKIIDKYCADVLRLFVLFAAPPDTDLEWSDEGIEGANRFLNRMWRLVEEFKDSKTHQENLESQRVLRKLHQTIKKVTEDIERFHFNTAIASIMEMVNTISQFKENCEKEILETVILLLAPFVPHFSEEAWELLGNKPSIFNQSWPKYNPKLVREEEVLIVIQINGRVRDKMVVPSGTIKEDVNKMVLNREKVQKWIANKKIEKIFFVPDKLINIVV